jgi:hypothetical protein
MIRTHDLSLQAIKAYAHIDIVLFICLQISMRLM